MQYVQVIEVNIYSSDSMVTSASETYPALYLVAALEHLFSVILNLHTKNIYSGW